MKVRAYLLLLLSPIFLSAKETWIIEHAIEDTRSMLTVNYYDSSKATPFTDSLEYKFKLRKRAFLEKDSITNKNNGEEWFSAMNKWGLLDYRHTVKAQRMSEPYNPLTDLFVSDFLLSGCNLNSKSTWTVGFSCKVITWVFSRE